MKGICPNCERETDVEFIQTTETFEIRGELVETDVEYYKCTICGKVFEDPRIEDDPLERAYREYRRRHGMTQPEAIRAIRKKYGLTQGELARLLGWGVATLSRYENGALQSSAHDRILALVTEPHNLLKLVDDIPDALTEEKRQRLEQLLTATISKDLSFERIYEDRFGAYEPDSFSGYKRLDLSKLFNAILYFCRGERISKTKVNKLLFYADFKHFKEYTVAITGARYARVPYGPAPDKYSYYFATLQEENAIEVEEIIFDQGAGEYFLSLRDPDLSIFTDSELKILTVVKESFKDFTAKAISDLSHQEKGYIDTPMGDCISYEYADDLKI